MLASYAIVPGRYTELWRSKAAVSKASKKELWTIPCASTTVIGQVWMPLQKQSEPRPAASNAPVPGFRDLASFTLHTSPNPILFSLRRFHRLNPDFNYEERIG